MIYEREVHGVQLNYDSETGKIWRLLKNTSPAGKKGDWVESGQSESGGYLRIWLAGKNVRVHRVAWFIVHGEWPSNLLDHIDRDRANNRLANLREATRSQNAMNSVRGKGWYFNRFHNVWQSYIRANGKRTYLGSFKTEKEARAVYQAAALAQHGAYSARVAA